MRPVLKNAVLHLHNEQPLLADLFELPSAADVAVRLTNLRTLDGKRPVSVNDMHAVFVFPYHRISFIEVPPPALVGTDLEALMPVAASVTSAVVSAANAVSNGDDDGELEIDEDFLRRIREV
jgi:hypothetical protein